MEEKKTKPPESALAGFQVYADPDAAGLDYAELSDWTSLVLLFRQGEEGLVICLT